MKIYVLFSFCKNNPKLLKLSSPPPPRKFPTLFFSLSGRSAMQAKAEVASNKLGFRFFEIINLQWLKVICLEKRTEVRFWGWQVDKNGEEKGSLQGPRVVGHVACSFTTALQSASRLSMKMGSFEQNVWNNLAQATGNYGTWN